LRLFLDKLLAILFVGALLCSCNSSLKLKKFPEAELSADTYEVKQDVKLSLSVIETGYSTTPEVFMFKGGRWFKKRKIAHISVLVQHPLGDFLFDTGLGSKVSDDVKNHFSAIQRTGSKHIKFKTVKETLDSNDYHQDSLAFILLSHLHWDHAGGVEDFITPLLYTTKVEYDHAFSEQSEESYFIKEQFDSINVQWKFLAFDSVKYKVFDTSLDLFNDGTVILVPLYGHTNGSIGMFVNLPSGTRYFFIGDAAWALEAITGLREKHPIPRKQVDTNRSKVQNQLVLLHYLQKKDPNLILVPSHDHQVVKGLAHFPLVEK